jgi:acyl carrier protein
MHDRMLDIIHRVVDELNERRDEKIPTDNLLEVSFYGNAAVFDSMQLVNFLARVEEAIDDEFDVEISLTSEKAVSQRISPFSSGRRLIEFAIGELDDAGVAGGGGGRPPPPPPTPRA